MSESGHGGKSGGLFAWLVHSPMAGSVALLAATVVALVWANSPWAEGYFELAHGYIGISWGDATFELSLQHWVNDFLTRDSMMEISPSVWRNPLYAESSFSRSENNAHAAAL